MTIGETMKNREYWEYYNSPEILKFRREMPKCTKVISVGKAIVLGREVLAVETHNRIYNQTLVWGNFSCFKGKFKGRFTNDASTEDVVYKKVYNILDTSTWTRKIRYPDRCLEGGD